MADVILTVHVAFILIVVGAVPLIAVGARRGWGWVRNPTFRLAHGAAVAYVAVETWLGATCPLTVWEAQSRGGGRPGLQAGFVAYWLHRLFFYTLPSWVFTLAYTVFGVVVAVIYWQVPPRRR